MAQRCPADITALEEINLEAQLDPHSEGPINQKNTVTFSQNTSLCDRCLISKHMPIFLLKILVTTFSAVHVSVQNYFQKEVSEIQLQQDTS